MDQVGSKWRNLKAKYNVEAHKVNEVKQQQHETGAAYKEDQSKQYTSNWHLFDIFRDINRGSHADPMEQAALGIDSESKAHTPANKDEGVDLTGSSDSLICHFVIAV